MGHFPAGDDDDIEARLRFMVPKDLASQTFCSVSDDCSTNFSCGRDAEPDCLSVV